MRRVRHYSFLVGVAAALGVIAGLVLEPREFFRSYLVAFLFCLGLCWAHWPI